MFKVEETSHITIGEDLVTIAIVIIAIFLIYFFSYNLQKALGGITNKISKKIGTFAVSKDFALKRYVYQHNKSPLTWLYNWINQQLIALGLKRQGVTPTGYLIFWGFCAILLGTVIGIILKMGVVFTFIFWLVCFIIMLMMTRVLVSERMEKREADVMNAIDLIIPEAGNGIMNAIVTYKDNFAPSIREDFMAFVSNIQDRGYSFEDAMYILSDQLGIVFRDFAQKAIYFEAVGEKEMLEIFSDITETNRLRRQLRNENTGAFIQLKTTFVVSVLMTFGYFCFIIVTDSFSRNFFLMTTAGKILLVVIVFIVFLVLSYITTIKSRAI